MKQTLLKYAEIQEPIDLVCKQLFSDYRSSDVTYGEQKVMCQIWDFWFYMGFTYGHTFNRYSREWSSYFYALPMVTNELLHWPLVNLIVKVTSTINYSSMGEM